MLSSATTSNSNTMRSKIRKVVIFKEYRYTVRRKGTSGTKVSILGPVGPLGSVGPGRRENLNLLNWPSLLITLTEGFELKDPLYSVVTDLE